MLSHFPRALALHKNDFSYFLLQKKKVSNFNCIILYFREMEPWTKATLKLDCSLWHVKKVTHKKEKLKESICSK